VPFPRTLKGQASGFTGVVDSTVLLTDGVSSLLTAVDLVSGRVRWRVDVGFAHGVQAFPLDATHVAVAGLADGSGGATERLLSLELATGRPATLWSGGGADGESTSDGGVFELRVAGRISFVVVDPDGSIHSLDPAGHQRAKVHAACNYGSPDLVGDTLACSGSGRTSFYALPGLQRRGSVAAVGGVQVVGGALVLDGDGELRDVLG
jgi:hypothetical protein